MISRNPAFLVVLVSSLLAWTGGVAQAELYLGSFQTFAHQVAGDVYLLSESVLEIRNYVYDGTGPAAFFWADTSATPSGGGSVIPDGSPSSGCAMSPDDEALPAANSITQRVEFPAGTTIRDYAGGSLSVWCEAFNANFGHVEFPSTIAESDIPTDGPELECVAPPSELFLGSFETLAHQVAGDVYLLSESVLEIRNYVYDGTGPAAFFWADTSATPSSGGNVIPDGSPSSGCAMSPEDEALPAANSITQRVEFPAGTTIRDYAGGSLSVWCEAFNANFGHVVFPSTIAESDIPVSGPELECVESLSEVFLGSFNTYSHLVAGDVYLLGERVLEIRNYVYDGDGPAAYFWADTNYPPTNGGIIMHDGAPSSGCALEVGDDALPEATGITQRVELPAGYTIHDFLGGSLSVWCEAFSANFGDIQFPASLSQIPSPGPELECGEPESTVPDIAKTPEGYNCEPLNEDFQVRWRINGDMIDIEVVGDIPENAYMAFGVSGSTTATQMLGADVVIADFPTSTQEARARDFFIDNLSQCTGVTGVCADSADSSNTDDVSSVSGEQDFDLTLVRFSRPLVPSDTEATIGVGTVDSSISLDGETFIVWALGLVNEQTGNPNFHSIAYARADRVDVSLEFGREVVDNCEPLVTVGSQTEAPTDPILPFNRPFVNDTWIQAHIGPSGGPRGYKAITGETPWGIAWYMNGVLIPELVLTRGTTYTFQINGGNNPADGANYHPFYITTNEFGGFLQLTPEERLQEDVFAGIVVTGTNATTGGITDFEVEALAPICHYETTAATSAAELSSYTEYAATLDMSCADDESLTSQAGTITFTPDENTPDLLYYQCVTHRNLGYRINIIDDGQVFTATPTGMPTSSPTNAPTATAEDLDGFEALALEGQLEGAELSYQFTQADDRAGGKSTITVVYEAPVEAWLAWGISNNGGFMQGSEAVIGLPSSGEVKKYSLNAYSLSGVVMQPDEQQTLIDASVRQNNGRTTLTFTKILEEEGEIPINMVGDNTFLSAWGLSNTLGIHAARGSYLASGAALEVREQSMWKVHGILAAIAWSVLSPLAIASSVLRKFIPGEGVWFKIHQTLNMLVVTFTIAACITAIVAINRETPSGGDASHFKKDFSEGHRTIGLVIFILACLQAIGGILRPHAPHAPAAPSKPSDEEEPAPPETAPTEKTTGRFLWEIGHKVLGLGLLGLCWYQVKLGITAYSGFFDNGDDESLLTVLYAVIGTLGGIIVIGYGLKLASP